MKLYIFLFTLFSFLFFFLEIASATPILFDIIPVNGTYIKGTDTDIFAVKINDPNLNVSTAYLHVRVEDPTSIWSNISMSSRCYNTSLTDWNCNTTVVGLSALAKDGNFLLYYFDAFSNDNSYGSNGTVENPNKVRIDRSGPIINFTNPTDKGYTGGSVIIKLSIADEFSGVNASTANYSFDNSTWLPTSQNASVFSASQAWDTTAYSNNQTVTLYAKTSDILGNENYTYINVTIDNEVPRLIILSPTTNQTLYDNALFLFKAEDTYSGLENTTAAFALDGTSVNLNCNGTIYSLNCSLNYNTGSVSDAPYNLTFSIKDKAGNLAQNKTSIIIDNLPPVISISNPKSNTEVNGIVAVNAAITDSGLGILNASFRWETSSSSGSWDLLNCSGSLRSLSCSGTWDSTKFSDGIYTIRLQAYDALSRRSANGVTITVKNLGISVTTTTTIVITTTTIPGTSPKTGPKISIKLPTLETLLKNWWVIAVAIVAGIAVVLLIYLFWPIKAAVYPGYKPK